MGIQADFVQFLFVALVPEFPPTWKVVSIEFIAKSGVVQVRFETRLGVQFAAEFDPELTMEHGHFAKTCAMIMLENVLDELRTQGEPA